MDWNEGLVIEQGPDAIEVYTHDFDKVGDSWLGTDTIFSHTISTEPVGLTVDADAHTDTTVTYRVSGGTVGIMYAVGVSILTASGRQTNKPVILYIDDPLAVRIAGRVR